MWDDYGDHEAGVARGQADALNHAAWQHGRSTAGFGGPRQPTADEVLHYRRLPSGTRDDLKAEIRGAERLDGVQHQFWDWTNQDVAAVLVELTGAREWGVNIPTERGFCVLTAAGHVEHRELPGDQRGPGSVVVRHAGPLDRFNAQMRPGLSTDAEGRPGRPQCSGWLSSYGPDFLDTGAIHRLRLGLPAATGAPSPPAHAAGTRSWVWLLLIVAALLVVAAVLL